MVELAREFFKSAEGKETLGNATSFEASNGVTNLNKAIPLESPETGEEPITVLTNPEGHDLPGANGSRLDDIIVAGPVDDHMPDNQGQSYIRGEEGYDTVVLQGSPDDYFITMPQSPVEYPGIETEPWENQTSLYGYNIKITNLNTGDTVNMTGIENIAFDPDREIENPRSIVKGTANLSEMEQIGIDEAIEIAETNMTPDELERAKIAATPEALSAVANDPELGKGIITVSEEEMYARSDAIVDDLATQEIDTSATYNRPETAQPQSPETLDEVGITVTVPVLGR